MVSGLSLKKFKSEYQICSICHRLTEVNYEMHDRRGNECMMGNGMCVRHKE